MRKIRIKQITPRRKGYTIFLGNGLQYDFPSKKQSEKFLADTSNWITHTEFRLNEVYLQVFMQYRRTHWYMVSGHECIERITETENLFDSVSRLSKTMNGCAYAFIQLTAICSLLRNVLSYVTPVHERRSQTAEKYTVEVILTDLTAIEQALATYCIEQATPQQQFSQLKITA